MKCTDISKKLDCGKIIRTHEVENQIVREVCRVMYVLYSVYMGWRGSREGELQSLDK